MTEETTQARTILFVDDEEKIRKYFSKIFRREFEVIVAADGDEGLRMFIERKGEIGLVVTDQMMPRTTGLELLAEVEKLDSGVVRVLSTAYADSKLVEEASRTGLFEFFVSKPWDIQILCDTLEKAAVRFDEKKSGSSGDAETPFSERPQAL